MDPLKLSEERLHEIRRRLPLLVFLALMLPSASTSSMSFRRCSGQGSAVVSCIVAQPVLLLSSHRLTTLVHEALMYPSSRLLSPRLDVSGDPILPQVAFALAFYALLQDDDERWRSIWSTLLSVFVMSMGEIAMPLSQSL